MKEDSKITERTTVPLLLVWSLICGSVCMTGYVSMVAARASYAEHTANEAMKEAKEAKQLGERISRLEGKIDLLILKEQ